MLPSQQGSLRLFRFSGIVVYLHWTWFLVAAYTLSSRSHEYSSLVWNAAEYLALFAIVLLHEFGHSLACRSTGGYADQIILWPFGGVAFVQPPPRPGAQLWSIAAGPLVNVALAPVLYLGVRVAFGRGLDETHPDFLRWLVTVRDLNLVLLVFNLLPIYPLDGGQILRSLLWFVIGPAKSLLVATVLGFLGGVALAAAGFALGATWTVLIAAFLLFNCWRGFQFARLLRAQEKAQPPPIPPDLPPPAPFETPPPRS